MLNYYYFRDFRFEVYEDVYEPSDDSLLLAENLVIKSGDKVLDTGTGIGIQAITAVKNSKSVLAVDIDPNAIETAKRNAELNMIMNIEFRISNLFDNIKKSEKFDLIIFNPPYLPSEHIFDASLDGGKNGTEVIEKFLKSVSDYLRPGGKFEVIVSSLNNLDNVQKRFNDNNLGFKIIANKKLWFEEIYVVIGWNKADRKDKK